MRHSSKSGAFLVEMIIVIAFFAVASAICIRLFVHAHSISRESRDRNMAVSVFQSAAETFKVLPEPEDLVASFGEDASLSGNTLLLGYGKDWNPSGPEDCAYLMIIEFAQSGEMAEADIRVQRLGQGDTLEQQVASSEALFRKTVYRYREGGAAE